MSRPKLTQLFLLLPILFTACGNKGLFTEDPPLFTFDTLTVRKLVRQQSADSPYKMYADAFAQRHFEQDTTFLWISEDGVSEQADILLEQVRQEVPALGFSAETFHVSDIEKNIADLRGRIMKGVTRDSVDTLMAHLEFQLTHTLLRYTYGQRYGYIRPHSLFNNLLVEDTVKGAVRYRRIFDINCDEPSDSFALVAMESVRDGRLEKFIRDIQPTDSLYYILQREYQRAQQQGDEKRSRLARINLERSRWRYPRPGKEKYVWVNMAGFELTARDESTDTTLTMRICGGSRTNKSPLLTSTINYMELNPYWVIPQSIIRKEIIADHLGDSAYFARNNIHAIEKETGEQIDPTHLTEAQLRSGRYALRQEKGEGNSLGRMIFRFPNRFSVYLHDTNNRSAFQRTNRAISHGCIRVERPLDLALFLGGKALSPFTVDRIRTAIDLPPLSEQGKAYVEKHPDATPMGSYRFASPTPLWIDYYTLFPTPDGSLQEHPDSYGYDLEIEKILNRL